ncbi:MAG: hypothetical protein ACJAYS_001163 [Lentimonas sp.]|jgi:hypothetical protein
MIQNPITSFTIAIIVSILASGCNTVRDTGYFHEYSILRSGRFLEKTWHSGENISQYNEIKVVKIDIEMIKDAKGITTEDARRELKKNLQRFSKIHGLRLIFDATDNSDSEYELKVAVTEMTPGSAAARIWFGELGIGHAKIQVEGRLSDQTTPQDIFLFSDRRGDSGAIGLADLGGDAGPSLVKKMLLSLAEDIVFELKYITEDG